MKNAPSTLARRAARSASHLVALGALFGALSVTGHAAAQTTLISGLGGAAGYGPAGNCLHPNDDGSSSAIDITPYFPAGLHFFAETHTSIYVNTNGNITFSAPLSTYTPRGFPVAARPMIAPFWGDVDIRGASCSTGSSCENPEDDGVWYFMEPGRIIITWDNVGHYRCEYGELNSFQLILSDPGGCSAPGDFDVEFRFARCEWEAGSASGDSDDDGICQTDETSCVPAQSGFDAGDETNYVSLPGSLEHGIHTQMCTGTNAGVPGVWRFSIRGGAITAEAGECDTGLLGVCAEGHTVYVDAETVCVPNIEASAEICDTLDNDCDGEVDEDLGMCGFGMACDNGICVEACEPGKCPGDEVCEENGLCHNTLCDDIVCPEGERCVSGECIDPCAEVTCPWGQECRYGWCVDTCEGVACSACGVCVDGACELSCLEEPCPAGETCMPDGSCMLDICASVSCDVGFHCESGACIDDCVGVACPHEYICTAGVCIAPPCGNGDLDPGELCDDGNTIDGDGCASDCSSDEACGNGIVDTRVSEACDDGNTDDGDGCSANCRSDETCGNRITDRTIGEVCDDGNREDGDGCAANCFSNERCGNGVLDAITGEVCDDGNTDDADGCAADCLSDETCGNGVLDLDEACDDGNTDDADGCSADCMSDETCGNGVVDVAVGEACDDGNTTNDDGCEADCVFAACGDGVLNTGEACDDGNNTDGDGCSANCASDETCGNGYLDLDFGEVCDDGDDNSDLAADACRTSCEPASCGDGVIDSGEECDNGAANADDAPAGGCTMICVLVSGGGDDVGEDVGDDTGVADTGVAEEDTGTGGDDVSTPDAGEADATAGADTGVSEEGGTSGGASGCACDQTPSRSTGWQLLAGLGLLAVIRRRR